MEKILLFIDCLGPGGAQRQFVGLARYLKESDYDVKVLTYFNEPFYRSFLDSSNIDYSVVQGAGNHYKRIPLIKNAVNAYCPDVIISFQETPSIIACILKMMGAKWKLIVSERNTTQVNNWKEWIRFNLFRKADFVVPNSYSQQRFITHNYSFLTDKTITISNFVDLEDFTPATEKPVNEKKEIVIAASIWPPKNTLGFIKAVAMLKERTTNFHIRWFGRTAANKDYAEQCDMLIAELGVSQYIELLDKTKGIADKYREADIFCLPSFYEGTPNVICEAMACGLPVVCSDVCDNAIYVKEYVNGWLFDPTQPADMADKLYKAITEYDEVIESFSKQSRETAEQNFSKEKLTQKYLELLYKLKKK